MKPPAPVRMWAVTAVANGGRTEVIATHTLRYSRRDAIAAHDEIWGKPGEYARRRRRGEVRVARVVVTEEAR